jgi:acetyl esterase/lipase
LSSPQLDRVLSHLRSLAARATEAAQRPVDERLEVLRQILNDYAKADPSVLEVVAEVRPLVVHQRSSEWLLPAGRVAGRRMLYIHGGSWMKGGLDSHRTIAARIAAATGCSVLIIDYRLAPEHPFPAGLEDCVQAFRWMLENGPEGPSRASQSFIAGDSAGGNLTLAALLSLKDQGGPLPDAAVPLSPVTDFTASGDSIRSRAAADPILNPNTLPLAAAGYLQHGEDLRSPLASPLYGDLAGLPPLFIQVGDAETLLDDSRRFAEKAKSAGVDVTLEIWPDMPHVFQFFAPYLPQAVEAIDHIAQFVHTRCQHSAATR